MPLRTQLPHLFVPPQIERADFAPVRPPIDDSNRPPLTARQHRYLHAQELTEQVDQALQMRIEFVKSLRVPDADVTPGVCLDVEGSKEHPLDFDALENKGSRTYPVELLNVRMADGNLKATIFVPERRLSFLKKKIAKYGDEKRDPAGTKDSTIAIDSIEAFKLAELESFWIDSAPLPVDRTKAQTWEAWLRKGAAQALRDKQHRFGIKVSAHSLDFLECEICLLTCSLETLSILQIAAMPLIGFRYREQAPGFFASLAPAEQAEWARELAGRVRPATAESPAVCVLDTGIRSAHTLLAPSLADRDCDAYEPEWGTDDTSDSGHGTEIGGMALLGDIAVLLADDSTIDLTHRLESVKILPPKGSNPEELYGWITQECAARAKVNAPRRKRVYCLAVTTEGRNTNGRPTAWSSTIDKLAMGVDAGHAIDNAEKKLFVVSVGNIRDGLKHEQYPSRNDLEPVENPAQAWNALSVGAITHKAFTDDKSLDGWNLLAGPGDLSPRSRTSVSWAEKEWPIKPDIVLEGGNCVSDGTLVSDDADLGLLTTGRDVPFVYTCDTSAATAQAARMAAILQAEYPNLWPETVRGLLVHSSRWNERMYRGKRPHKLLAEDKASLLRRFGYGLPSLEVARYSASNRACLVVQHELQPFVRPDGDSSAGYKDMNVHTLPWPASVLRDNGAIRVRLRVTLSYFVEPNPAERLPTLKYSYASHRLRFDLQRPLETVQTLRQRVNKKDRPEAFTAVDSSNNWHLGSQARNRGSVISDVWTGTAAELADQSSIVVLPEGGWWKYRKHLNRGNEKARYALVVSLETESEEIDIYTAIRNQIELPTEIAVR